MVGLSRVPKIVYTEAWLRGSSGLGAVIGVMVMELRVVFSKLPIHVFYGTWNLRYMVLL